MMMAPSTHDDKRASRGPIRHVDRGAEQFLKTMPGAREAIQQRIMDDPEYRRWLQQFGQGLLKAVE